jgi:hypothetical protein
MSQESDIPTALRSLAHRNRQLSQARGGRSQSSSYSALVSRCNKSSKLVSLSNPKRSGTPTSPQLSEQSPSHTDFSTPKLEMTNPSQTARDREKSLRDKQIREFSLEDFCIDGSSDGTSLLVSRLVLEIEAFHTDMTPFQLARLVAHAIIHHPLRLLDYLRHTQSMNDFVVASLSTFPLDISDPYSFCPLKAP